MLQAKKDKKEKKQAGSEGDFEIKPDKSVPQIDTSKWPLLLKVSELILKAVSHRLFAFLRTFVA